MVMIDEQACEKFRRWSSVKQSKDISMSEKKSLTFNHIQRSSFRNTKTSSLFSEPSLTETKKLISQ